MKQYYQGLSLKVKLFVIFLLVIIANFVANLFYRHEVKNLIEFIMSVRQSITVLTRFPYL